MYIHTRGVSYLYKQVEEDNGFHFQLRVDFIIEVVVGDFANITKRRMTHGVYQRYNVTVTSFEDKVREEIQDCQTAHVEW